MYLFKLEVKLPYEPVHPYVGRSVFGLSVYHNFLIWREVSLPYSYRGGRSTSYVEKRLFQPLRLVSFTSLITGGGLPRCLGPEIILPIISQDTPATYRPPPPLSIISGLQLSPVSVVNEWIFQRNLFFFICGRISVTHPFLHILILQDGPGTWFGNIAIGFGTLS